MLTQPRALSDRPIAPSVLRAHLLPCLLILAASALLMLPAFLHGIPNGDDAAMHYRRHADFIEALREGVWYPRWLPRSNFHQGTCDVVLPAAAVLRDRRFQRDRQRAVRRADARLLARATDVRPEHVRLQPAAAAALGGGAGRRV